MKRLHSSLLLFFPILSSLAPSGFAQPFPDAAVQQVETVERREASLTPAFRNAAPSLYEGEIRDVGPQYLVEPKAARRKWFEFAADGQYFYTSNVFLTEKGATDTGLYVGTLQAGVAPSFDLGEGTLTLRAGYRHTLFAYAVGTSNHERLDNFDFEVSTIYTQARYAFKENYVATVGLDYNRLLNAADGSTEFYVEAVPSWTLQRLLPINDNMSFALGYTGNYHFTRVDPNPRTSINNRTDQILSLTYSQQLVPKLFFQAYGRIQYSYYADYSDDTSNARKDFLYSTGVSLTYYVTDWASIRAFTNYDKRNSNDRTVSDYGKFDTGGGLSLALQF